MFIIFEVSAFKHAVNSPVASGPVWKVTFPWTGLNLAPEKMKRLVFDLYRVNLTLILFSVTRSSFKRNDFAYELYVVCLWRSKRACGFHEAFCCGASAVNCWRVSHSTTHKRERWIWFPLSAGRNRAIFTLGSNPNIR